MSSFSSASVASRLAAAIAQECRVLAEGIARLGEQVSAGSADITAMQSFDLLSQHALAQAILVEHLATIMEDGFALERACQVIGAIPLPQVRERLLFALRGEFCPPGNDDEMVLWID